MGKSILLSSGVLTAVLSGMVALVVSSAPPVGPGRGSGPKDPEYWKPADPSTQLALTSRPREGGNGGPIGSPFWIEALHRGPELAPFDFDVRYALPLPPAPARPPTPGSLAVVVDLAVKYHGVPLEAHSGVTVVRSEDERTNLLRVRNLPRIESLSACGPEVDPAEACRVARAHFGRSSPRDAWVVGAPRLEIRVDHRRDGHLAWVVDVKDGPPVLDRAARYWIAARGGSRILAVEDLIFHAVTGKVVARVWTNSTREIELRPLSHAKVTHPASGAVTYTGDDGAFQFPKAEGPSRVTVGLSGEYCRVHDSRNEPLKADAEECRAPAVIEIKAKAEFELAQTSAFYWVNRTRDFARALLDPLDESRKILELSTVVNIDDACNAFYDPLGMSLNFFRGGEGCSPTAYSNVVTHEYGHCIDQQIGEILDGGYSEGFGDAVSLLMTRDPIIGRDFLGPGKHLRDVRQIVDWGTDGEGDIHHEGLIYAGFVWELTRRLIDRYRDEDKAFPVATHLVLSAAALNPSDIREAVFESFLVDDDDADLANGTQHYEQLAAAARSRKIPFPEKTR